MEFEGVDLAVLAAWMNGRAIGHGPIEHVERLAGGTQNIIIRFRRGSRTFVLRRPPVHLRPNSNETMRREARVLGALAGSVVPHPALVAQCDDETVLGAAFYLMEPIDGFTATTGLPPRQAASPELRHRMGLSMAEGIARLGELDYQAIGLEGFGKPDNYLERQVSRWCDQLFGYARMEGWTGVEGLPGVLAVGEWLEANRPDGFRAGVIHGDYHLGNVMFGHKTSELAAIIDWELSTIGDPLLDLGWMLATWPEGDEPGEADVATTPWHGFPREEELIRHYAANSTRAVGSVGWYVVLACYKLAIILEGTHARACAGQAPRETGDKLHNHAVALLDRATRRIG